MSRASPRDATLSSQLPCRAAGAPRTHPYLSRAARSTYRRGGAVRHYPNSWSRCVSLPRPHQALPQPCLPRLHPAQASREPAQLPACRQSPCTHTNCSLECTPAPPHAGHSRAESERAAPSRMHTQARAAPFTSRADHQKPKRSVREVCFLRSSATSPQVEL